MPGTETLTCRSADPGRHRIPRLVPHSPATRTLRHSWLLTSFFVEALVEILGCAVFEWHLRHFGSRLWRRFGIEGIHDRRRNENHELVGGPVCRSGMEEQPKYRDIG